MIEDPIPIVPEDLGNSTTLADQDNVSNTFAYSITGLEEYTNYTCTITARNVFGIGLTSDTINIMTNSTGTVQPVYSGHP